MSECAICGRRQPAMCKIELEGAIVNACDDCTSYGRVVSVPREIREAREPAAPARREVRLLDVSEGEEAQFAKDFGKRIVLARELRGMARQDFASRLGEKESLVKRVENQETEPDESLTKKIESFLKIKLRDADEKENGE